MKRLVLALTASAMVAGPLMVATTADAQPRNRGGYDQRWDQRDRHEDRWDRRDDRRDRHDRYDRRDDRRDRGDRWDNRRWDNNRYNGYYYGNRWSWGPPPVAYNYRYDVRPGYRPWQRGAYLPPAYRGNVVYNYNSYRLRPPPRGYHWVRSNDDFILSAIATGLIIDIIAGR